MIKDYTYPQFFFNLMDQAAKVKNLPINKETVQLFWNHIKKYSVDEETIRKAMDEVVEQGLFLDPGYIIQRIPREYPKEKEWPKFDEIVDANKSNIAQDCLRVIFAKMNGDLDREEYSRAMLKLEDKYSNIQSLSFRQAAEMYRKGKRLP